MELSACAENTIWRLDRFPMGRNYLRVRGEYIEGCRDTRKAKELPPRTRRIRKTDTNVWTAQGTTSAYAENTSPGANQSRPVRNYLRVRGEYSATFAKTGTEGELPPRTRRIPIYRRRNTPSGGTTSAYAENTFKNDTSYRVARNYLRVRGEYVKSARAIR